MRKLTRKFTEAKHGTISEYTYGCRCYLCSTAKSLYGVRRDPRRMQSMQELYSSTGVLESFDDWLEAYVQVRVAKRNRKKAEHGEPDKLE